MCKLRIRDLREDKDMNQSQIAEILKTTQQQYSKYENETQEIPVRHIITLAKYYNVSLDYICGLTNQKKPITSNAPRYTDNGNHDQERRSIL